MNAGTIFVLCLAAGFVIFVVYLAVLSRRAGKTGPDANDPQEQDKRLSSSDIDRSGAGVPFSGDKRRRGMPKKSATGEGGKDDR